MTGRLKIDQRTTNLVHYPSKDDTDPNALDEYLDTYAPKAGLHELWLPASVWLQGSGATYGSNSLNSSAPTPVFSFDDSANEFINYAWAPPKRWNLGTITYQVFWSLEGTSTGNVLWRLEAGSFSDGDAVTNAFASGDVLDAGHGTDGFLNVSAVSGALTIAGSPAASDLVRLTLLRVGADGTDTATGDAHMIGLKVFWTANAGSDD